MKELTIKIANDMYVLRRDFHVVCISRDSARIADIVMDLLDNEGKLTLIPEPSPDDSNKLFKV